MTLQEHLELLRKIEWSGDSEFFICPDCEADRDHSQHNTDCQLDRAIKDLEGQLNLNN